MKRLIDFHIGDDEEETLEQRLVMIENRQRDGGFKVTDNGPVMVVTYKVTVTHEEIEGRTVAPAPAQRLSVWLKTGAGWQWVAHANLAPLRD